MDIGTFHPQIVHFVIALFVVGVVFRFVSLTGRLSFTNPAATTLIVLSAVAAVLAAKSGDDAHGVAERIPGARNAVENHEEWGERARNLLLLIAAVEVVGLVIGRSEERRRAARAFQFGSVALSLIGLFVIYEAGEHGGEVVYSYGGGVGTRSGAPEDLDRLLVAALYHNAMRDREQGRKDDAARLIEEMARRHSANPEVRLMLAESMLEDRKDPRTALNLLALVGANAEPRLRARAGLLKVDAYESVGWRDSATIVLQALKRDFPDNARIAARQLSAPIPVPVVPVESIAPPPTTTTNH